MDALLKKPRELHAYQKATIEAAFSAPGRRWLINYSTGLGKSATAIRFASRIAARRILVFTPAVVRAQWVDEFASWGMGLPPAMAITYGKTREKLTKAQLEQKAASYAADIQIVSYSLVEHVDTTGWDLVIFDECHRLKNPASKQSKLVRQLLQSNPTAAVLGLTATLFPDSITDIWNQLDLLWPARFGSASAAVKYPSWKFCNRYSLDVGNEYGAKWSGINQAHKEELRLRLAAVSSRVTKHEVAHLLPPFLVSLNKIPSSAGFNSVEDWALRQGKEKLPFVKEWLDDALEESSHVCILTHLRKSADDIAEMCAEFKDISIFCITGEMEPSKRNEVLKCAAREPKAVIVATMHSVGIGINLGFCPRVLFAELYWRPETVIQALGRFDGFRAKEPVTATILCLQGTVDEAMASKVLDKIEAYSQALKASTSEEKLLESLGGVRMSDVEAIAALNAALFGVAS